MIDYLLAERGETAEIPKDEYLELGVGGNTPVIIKYPFWQLTAQNENAFYICVNFGESYCPDVITDQAICVNADIGKKINDLK